jgi:hypothetical protein
MTALAGLLILNLGAGGMLELTQRPRPPRPCRPKVKLVPLAVPVQGVEGALKLWQVFVDRGLQN